MSKEQSFNLHSKNKVGIPRARARFLSQSMQLEESDAPGVASGGIFLTIILIIGAIIWSAKTQVTELAMTTGEVIPSGLIHNVQHLEGGIVAEVLVRNGDRVSQGDTLMHLTETTARSELDQLKARRVGYELQIERINAILESRKPDFSTYETAYPKLAQAQQRLYKEQLLSEQEQIKSIRSQGAERSTEASSKRSQLDALREEEAALLEQMKIQEDLMKRQAGSQLEILDTKGRLAKVRSEMVAIKGQMSVALEASAGAEQREKELVTTRREELRLQAGDLSNQLKEVDELIVDLNDRLLRRTITSPANGIVKSLAVTTIGGVVEPGQILMEVVPVDDEMLVESRIQPKDIGHVQPGQDVDVKVSSYEYQRYGSVSGTLKQVSASTYLDEEQQPYYRAEVLLAQAYVGSDPAQRHIVPGMTVQADVITGKKTVLDYILKPIYRGFQGSFHER